LSYVLNSLFVFRAELRVSKAIQFPIVYVAQYAMGIIILALAVEIGGLPERLGALISIAFSIPLTFAISRFILKGASPQAVR
jgi:putative flippase GtrA